MTKQIHIHIHRTRAADQWNESDHPREANGQFSHGDGASPSKLPASGAEREKARAEADQLSRSAPDAAEYGPHYRAAAEIDRALRRSGPAAVVRGADGKLVGAISWKSSKEALHVQDLGSLQRGAGSALMQVVENEADKSKKEVTLFADPSAIGFYEKRGYKVDRDGKTFHGSLNVLMRRPPK